MRDLAGDIFSAFRYIVERFLAGRVVEIGVFAHEILIEDVMLIVFVETLYQKGHIMFLLGTEFFGVI